MKNIILFLFAFFFITFSHTGFLFSQSNCPSNLITDGDFPSGVSAPWAIYPGSVAVGQDPPYANGCSNNPILLGSGSTPPIGGAIYQSVAIQLSHCYDFSVCLEPQPVGQQDNKVFVFASNSLSINYNDLITGNYTPAQAELIMVQQVFSPTAPNTYMTSNYMPTNAYIYLILLNSTDPSSLNGGAEVYVDNVCLIEKICAADPCDSLTVAFTYTNTGLNYQFTDLSTITGGTIIGWSWNFGDPNSGVNNTSALQNPSHLFTGTGLYVVCLTVTATANGMVCPSQTICNDIFITAPADPCDSLTVAFTYTNTGLNYQFTDLSTITGGTIIGWSWNFGDPSSGVNNTSALQNPSHLFTGTGLYVVCLTVTATVNGIVCPPKTICSDIIITDPVDPCPNLVADFTYTGNGTSYNFSDASILSGFWAICSYSWDFGDPASGINNTSALQNPAHNFSASGPFTVCLTVTFCDAVGFCVETICKEISVVTGIEDTGEVSVSIYPNPVQNYLNIVLPETMPYSVIIYNYLGQEVISATPSTRIDMQILPSGLYYAEIRYKSTLLSSPLLKSKGDRLE